MPKLTVEIVTAERSVLETEADVLIAPSTEGTIGILPRHAPLLTALKPGVMTLRNNGVEELLAVSGGFLQVSNNRVLILADTAERAEELDEQRAAEAVARAQAALAEARSHPGEALQASAARAALSRSLARLNVAQRRKRRTST